MTADTNVEPGPKVVQITMPRADWLKARIAAAQAKLPISKWLLLQAQPALDKLPDPM